MSNMKTVGDFKKAGGEVVRGDICISHGSNQEYKVIMHPQSAIEWDEDEWDEDEIKSLAWRTNKGVKPEFVGDVEFELRNGGIGVSHTDTVSWGINLRDISSPVDVIKWRPHLPAIETETPEEEPVVIGSIPDDVFYNGVKAKPVFTQEMADKGELPMVGSEAGFLWSNLTETSGSNQNRTLSVIGYNSANTEVWAHVNGEAKSDIYRIGMDIKFKPIKTEREKAIESLSEFIRNHEIYSNADGFIKLATAIYDADYRKEDK